MVTNTAGAAMSAPQIPQDMLGRRIVITGAGSGIGRATAALFTASGAKVALVDLNAEAVAKAAAEVGGSAHAADVTDAASVEAALAGAEAAMGGIDGLVLCAGIMSSATLATTQPAEWDRVIAVNLTGTYLCSHLALPRLQAAGGGTIVTIASGQALLPNASGLAYAASKGGVLALAKSMAVELAPAIRVNTVCPGAVNTPMAAGVFQNMTEAQMQAVHARYALNRLAEADEIAEALLFLSGPRSSAITGVALAVDCGRTFH